MKNLFSFFFLCLTVSVSCGQTLFTFGRQTVSKQEFLKAYNKNNTGEKPTEKSYRDYLDLYTKFKLKVQAAKDLKLDTLFNQKAELQNFRGQIVETYMNDQSSLDLLVDEAMARSKTDIHLAHIFVAVKADATEADIAAAEKKISRAYNQLAKESFETVAKQYSEDPSVKINNGDIGYITVFVLPYDMESVAYNTPEGKYSRPFRSKSGFHIFKNLDKRKAVGRIRVAQVLVAFPPEATESQKLSVKQKADSIYNALKTGGDFKMFAAQFSDDNISYQAGGEMPEFGVGRYDPVFESAAFALSHDGDVSSPVQTEYGYHILKRLQRQPINEDQNNRKLREAVRQQVTQNDRMEVSRNLLLKKIQQEVKFKKSPVNEKNLLVFTDSIVNNKQVPTLPGLNENTILFSFEKQTIRLRDYRRYLEAIVEVGNKKTPLQLYNDFLKTTSQEYYRDHLEEYNKEFAYQLKEFSDGNLLFEVMQRKVWDIAASDSVGLKKYYGDHKEKYWWESSADAIIITSGNEEMMDKARKELKADYKTWKKLIDSSNGVLMGDSGRFELSQIPVREKTNFSEGLITAAVKNETDNSTTFSYIIKMYKNREPRSFDDARGFVINDYQGYLENNWVAELKKKYPVRVNENVFNSLPK